jgi:type I restriction enzyme S subunit
MKILWPSVKLSEIAPITRRPIEVDASASYPELGIRSFGKGTFHKPALSGMNVGTKRLFRIEPGDLVFSNVFAWEGAVAVATDNDAERYGSHRFIACTVDENRADARYLCQYLLSPPGILKLQAASPGGAGRNRTLGIDKLGEIEVPLPPVIEQRRIVAQIGNIQDQLHKTDTLRESIEQDIASLLAVQFNKTLAHATWKPMREVAPIVRRDVIIDLESNYSELGVRSFFKGAFIRRNIKGAEFTWQKLYQVKPNDLIFSNIMAWEKGIALASAKHDLCVGNHRMLTCEAITGVALSAYLHYYFTTDAGFSKVYAASPGTAARNRTLTADSLMGIEVPVPSLGIQQQFVNLKEALERSLEIRQKQREFVEALMPSLCHQSLS